METGAISPPGSICRKPRLMIDRANVTSICLARKTRKTRYVDSRFVGLHVVLGPISGCPWPSIAPDEWDRRLNAGAGRARPGGMTSARSPELARRYVLCIGERSRGAPRARRRG